MKCCSWTGISLTTGRKNKESQAEQTSDDDFSRYRKQIFIFKSCQILICISFFYKIELILTTNPTKNLWCYLYRYKFILAISLCNLCEMWCISTKEVFTQAKIFSTKRYRMNANIIIYAMILTVYQHLVSYLNPKH